MCYFHGKKTFSSSEILMIILGSGHNNKICCKVPIGIQKNAVFVIDATRLKSPDDIRADDLGVWVNNGVRRSFLTCKSVGNTISKVEVVSKEPNMPLKYYQLMKSYFYHKQSKDYKRIIYQLYGGCIIYNDLT